jgi:hypothetical protein
VVTTQDNDIEGRHYEIGQKQEEWKSEDTQLVLKGEL